MGRALRIFYQKSNNQIVWQHETRSPEGKPAISPTTIEEDLANIPDKMPDGKTPLDYGYIEVGEADIDAYFASDNNRVIDNKLAVGTPRIEVEEPPPEPPRDLAAETTTQKAEIDELRVEITELKLR